jgi:hypothetical protein
LLVNWLTNTNCNFCHQCEVFYNTNFLTFRSLRRANHTKMGVMQKSWFGGFRTWLYGCNHSS